MNLTVERTYQASVEELWALWTTKEGFESWWGPEGFRVEVHALEPKLGGRIHYDMIAATPEMVKAMKDIDRPSSHETRGTFSEYAPHTALALTHVIDFLPEVKPYDATIRVRFEPRGDRVRMVVSLPEMHNREFSGMQLEGFTSQIGKLDRRYAR